MSGHTKRSDMDHKFYLQITPCLPFSASVHQMEPPLTEVEGIWFHPFDPEGTKG